eukprot:354820-Chlamydomonas_euryale.AAC.4
MVLESGRLSATACAADSLAGQTWLRAACGLPKGWPQSAPACDDARMHACLHMPPSIQNQGPGKVPFGCFHHQGRESSTTTYELIANTMVLKLHTYFPLTLFAKHRSRTSLGANATPPPVLHYA